MKIHPVAEIFPPMSDAEFGRLCEDIQRNGLLEPVWTYQGAIIDGRHRAAACQELGIELRSREWSGTGSLVNFVISVNLQRRHLSESQRALVAARLANMRQGERNDLNVTQICGKLSQPEAAELLNVSPRSVSSAAKVLESGVTVLHEKVEDGTLSINAAVQVAQLPAERQKRILRRGRQSTKNLLERLKTKSIQKAKIDTNCLICSPTATATKESVSTAMQLLAHRFPQFAVYFNSVADELEEIDLSDETRAAYDVILDAIDLGFQEFAQLQAKTKYSKEFLRHTITVMVDYSMIEEIEQGGKTHVARGARKIIYRRPLDKI